MILEFAEHSMVELMKNIEVLKFRFYLCLRDDCSSQNQNLLSSPCIQILSKCSVMLKVCCFAPWLHKLKLRSLKYRFHGRPLFCLKLPSLETQHQFLESKCQVNRQQKFCFTIPQSLLDVEFCSITHSILNGRRPT